MLKIVEAGDMIRRGVATRELLDTLANSLLAGGIQFGAIIIEKIMNFITRKQSEEAYQEYKKTVEAMTIDIKDFAEASLLGTSAEIVVNVYGTKDVLGDLKVNGETLGGYRSELLGFTQTSQTRTLFNIEIVGARHNDYIRNDLGSDLLPIVDPVSGVLGYAASIIDHQWNKTVSEFVSLLILNSASTIKFNDFLGDQARLGVAKKDGDRWVISLTGSAERA